MADTRLIARRYAQALFEIVQEGGPKALVKDLQALADAARIPEVAGLLQQPKVDAGEKEKLLVRLAKVQSKEAQRLVALLCRRGKAGLLPEIHELFRELEREAAAKVEVTVVSAVPLSERAKEALARTLESSLGKRVTLKLKEDATILGGLLLQVGDRRIDATLRGRLEGLRRLLAA